MTVIDLRSKVRCAAGIVLLTIFAVGSGALAQTPTPKPKPSPGATAPKGPNPKLVSVKFAKDMSQVEYEWKLKSDVRILTLPLKTSEAGNHVTVKKPGAKKPLIDVFVTASKGTATTPKGVFELAKRKRTLPPKTDALAIWVLGQDYRGNKTLDPRFFYEAATAQLKDLSKGEEVKITPYKADSFSTCDQGRGLTDCWSEWFSWDNCYGRGGTCTETDSSGNRSSVTIYCDCGVPICEVVRTSVTVTVAVFNATTHTFETEERTVDVSKCLCFCQNFGEYLAR